MKEHKTDTWVAIRHGTSGPVSPHVIETKWRLSPLVLSMRPNQVSVPVCTWHKLSIFLIHSFGARSVLEYVFLIHWCTSAGWQ